MERLPESFEGRLEALYGTLEDGLEKLLTTARSKGVLQPPFGRPLPYSPYLSGPLTSSAAPDGDEDIKFSYQYGFNALTFLSDILRKAHPESVIARKQERLDISAELARRAAFAQVQCGAAAALRADARCAPSGIALGPFTAPVSPTAILCVVWPRCIGQIVLQISSSDDFTVDLQTLREPVTDVSNSCRLIINDLTPSKLYYIRCCVEDESLSLAKSKNNDNAVDDFDFDGGAKPVPTEINVEQAGENEQLDKCFLKGLSGDTFHLASCWTLPSESSGEAVDQEGAGSRPASAPSESHITEVIEKPAMFSLLVIGGLDRALESHVTRTYAGVDSKWPGLYLNSALDVSSPIYAPPSSQSVLSDVWPPAVDPAVAAAPEPPRPRPLFTCLVGDIYPIAPTEQNDLRVVVDSEHEKQHDRRCSSQVYRLLKSAKLFSDPSSVIKHSSVILAWNDASVGADQALKQEESIYKQWAHDKRKHEKKMAGEKGGRGAGAGSRRSSAVPAPPAPSLERPAIAPTLASLTEHFPVLLEEEETRKLYRSIFIGPQVELLVLDTRRGYLGKNQSKWLKHRLATSTSTWKIVVSGSSFGRVDVRNETARASIDNSCGNQGEVSDAAAIADEDAVPRMVKSVSITKLDDLDEHGRFKDGIQAILYSLQKEAVALDEDASLGGGSGNGGSIGALGAIGVPPDEVPLVDSRPWQERIHESVQQRRRGVSDEKTLPHEIYAVSSGIILLTGNGSRGSESTDGRVPRNSGSTKPGVDSSQPPSIESCFVSLYNPKDLGDVPFCAEVNVSGKPPGPSEHAALDGTLGAYCVYPPSTSSGPNPGGHYRDVVCVVHSTEGGADHKSGIMIRLADASSGEVMYESSFVVPPPPVPAERLDGDTAASTEQRPRKKSLSKPS